MNRRTALLGTTTGLWREKRPAPAGVPMRAVQHRLIPNSSILSETTTQAGGAAQPRE